MIGSALSPAMHRWSVVVRGRVVDTVDAPCRSAAKAIVKRRRGGRLPAGLEIRAAGVVADANPPREAD